MVLGKDPYVTAFFEVFPGENSKSGGFIRGEGKTISEAEDAAFQKHVKRSDCDHLWGREKYRNTGQMCRFCRAFRCDHIPPVVELGHHRKPLSRFEASWVKDLEEDSDDREYLNNDPQMRALVLRLKLFGVNEDSPASPFIDLLNKLSDQG